MKITATEVNDLRKSTGAGMMDCKKALVEANGDHEKAVEILRKKGQKVAANRAERDSSEGVVLLKVNDDKSEGFIISLNCETDFVAKNKDFLNFANEILDIAENVNDDQEPDIKEQIITKEQNDEEPPSDDIDEESPSDDILKDAINPIFTESEFVPERKFDGEVGSVPNEQDTVEDDKSITDYKNPNSKYEKTKQVSPILEDDTEPEKIILETPSTSDTFVFKNWDNIIDLGNSWYELEWFGIFYTTGDDFKGTGWIYHLELGWVFISSKNYESVWIWSDQLGGWKWTSETTFPYLFLNNTGSWLFFNQEKKLFYNYAQNKWFDTPSK